MRHPLDAEIRDQLARYVAGQFSLVAFQEWFIPRSWNVQRAGDQRLEDVVYEIELRLAEYTSGPRTEDDLRRLFSSLLMTGSTQEAPDARRR